MICQLKEYIEELHENFTKLFEDNPLKDLETLCPPSSNPHIGPRNVM